MKSVFIGFDFSMNKPAMTALYDKMFYFFIWPLEMTKKQIEMYDTSGVFVHCRNLPPITTKDRTSQIVLEHTKRSTDLANMIMDDLDRFLYEYLSLEKDTPIYVSSEGLAFSAKGDATLNLATYKGVLLSKLYERYFGRMYGLYTYSPITMKSVAGCAKKGELTDKNKMISAFAKEKLQGNGFHDDLI